MERVNDVEPSVADWNWGEGLGFSEVGELMLTEMTKIP